MLVLIQKKYPVYFFLLLFSFFFQSKIFAQLKADFTVDKNAGCSPLTVSFTNTTTGASGAATYKWDFGNGNPSTLKNPGATYITEKTYTVTLTVTDGGSSATQTQTITVYKKPTVDFSASPAKGCLPLPVNFSSNSTAGDGTIANYFWDYGDGNTQQGATLQQNSHTYNFAENASISLTVTNSFGCYSTAVKPIVDILPAINASFTEDKTVLCTTADVVTFSNTSNGPGTLSYLWDFGDNTSSTNISPSHTYSAKGVYNVKLTVSNTDGCSNTTSTQTINVANFTADFTVPLLCKGQTVNITNTSTTGFTNATWQIDGNTYPYYYYSFSYGFGTIGQHTIQLTDTYGTCSVSVSKQVTVKDVPAIKPFVITTASFCDVPATVNVNDTSTGIATRAWTFDWPYNQVAATTQAASHVYTSENYYTINLAVTNADGCTASESQYINIFNPRVAIVIVKSSNNTGCGNTTITFQASPADQIASYQWTFGDGGTSTDAIPQHTYTTQGNFTIQLNYVTKDGCKRSVSYNSIEIYKKPVADFVSMSGTSICGNTPVIFNDKSTGNITNWVWDFGGNNNGYYGSYNNANPTVQYLDSGTYTIRLIAYNGTCSDTMTKINYIKVNPPFPKINSVANTCNDTRGLVKFTEISKYAQTWKWNFGDGTSSQLFTTKQDTVSHLYTKTGSYKVVLTTTNGQCSVNDSMLVYVLLKQNPALSSTKTTVCSSDVMNVTINNLEANPAPYAYIYDYYYGIKSWQYGDGTLFPGYSYSNGNYDWQTTYQGTLTGLSPAKQNLRVILQSSYFGCADTSNFLPIKIKGPIAGFKFTENNVCYKSPVIFQDTSVGTNNVGIKSWVWNFGDGTSSTLLKGGTVAHLYPNPGNYNPTLTVTDSDGCYASTTYNYYANAIVNGPKAGFNYYPTSVSPNTPVNFYNNTNTYNSYTTQYKWDFGGGNTTTNYYPSSISYPVIGLDTVKLIAKDPTTGCADTSVQIIYVKNVNTAFTFTLAYINANSCPPVIARFRNTSVNATSVSWDFGDGSTADNQNYPSHTYLNAGVYKVTLYGSGIYGTRDSTTDSITIQGPYAKLHADVLGGCLKQTVTLGAEVKNAATFTWDFADGTLLQSSDTFAVHSYLSPGLYTPSLILKDSSGCTSTSTGDEIVIDTLNVLLHQNPDHFCDSALVLFTPDIVSLAASQVNEPLSYQWDFGTGNPTDTSSNATPSFDYTRIGTYHIKLSVQSPYGCAKETSDSIVIVERSKGTISGPSDICRSKIAQFDGAATIVNNGTTWSWDFKNGIKSLLQKPGLQTFADAGIVQILLVVDNNGCADSSYHQLTVHAKPVIGLTPKQASICLGKSVLLTAHDGTVYSWQPANGLGTNGNASTLVTPLVNTTYIVNVANAFGCSDVDSSSIIVAQPFSLKVPADTIVCAGSNIHLYAIGADTYKYIGTITGLNNTQIANPIASPLTPVVYTVVGYDDANCFTDTATINIDVKPAPTVNAGADVETLTGTQVQLNATGSSDIIEWNWLPIDYLSCMDCRAPISTPLSEITYAVTATNNYGCSATDNVFIKLICTQQFVFIPKAFTPNNDGKNDVFYIKGRGVRMIRSFRIYSRWGETVYERTNIHIDDRSTGWDGTYKGIDVPAGTYTYMAQMECDTGENFEMNGTVVVIH